MSSNKNLFSTKTFADRLTHTRTRTHRQKHTHTHSEHSELQGSLKALDWWIALGIYLFLLTHHHTLRIPEEMAEQLKNHELQTKQASQMGRTPLADSHFSCSRVAPVLLWNVVQEVVTWLAEVMIVPSRRRVGGRWGASLQFFAGAAQTWGILLPHRINLSWPCCHQHSQPNPLIRSAINGGAYATTETPRTEYPTVLTEKSTINTVLLHAKRQQRKTPFHKEIIPMGNTTNLSE